jgi:Fic family protein
MYVRKEALLSSQIEGTQSSLSDLLLFENDEIPQIPIDDVTEVSNYVAAIEHGIARMRGGFPLSLRLIREMHEVLLRSGRGASKQPGEFRNASVPSRLFCTATIPRCRRCCGPGLPMCSSRPSTPS